MYVDHPFCWGKGGGEDNKGKSAASQHGGPFTPLSVCNTRSCESIDRPGLAGARTPSQHDAWLRPPRAAAAEAANAANAEDLIKGPGGVEVFKVTQVGGATEMHGVMSDRRHSVSLPPSSPLHAGRPHARRAPSTGPLPT